MIREAISTVVAGNDLSEDEAAAVMNEIMEGEATPAQLGAFLTALRLKGEAVDEIAGMARVMRDKANRISVEGDLLDTCGTGGDGAATFNVSTAAAFVAAGAGARVAKHGNRAMSSRCGSADVLEALGAKIDLTPMQSERCLRETGFCFMFAPHFHPAMKHAAGPRREIGVRTVFNVLGPLTNPAGARYQVLGVAERRLAEKMANVLARLGSARALVVHGEGGLDELTVCGSTEVWRVENGGVTRSMIDSSHAGLRVHALEALAGGTPEENAEALRRVLYGERGALRDFTLLNAAAGIVAVGLAEDIAAAVRMAAESIDSRGALRKLNDYVEVSNSCG